MTSEEVIYNAYAWRVVVYAIATLVSDGGNLICIAEN